MSALRSPERTAVDAKTLTISDCDREIADLSGQMRAKDGDQETEALCRYQIDYWLDLRSALMRYA